MLDEDKIRQDLKEIVRLARMANPTDTTIRIARIAETTLESLPSEPEPVKLESVTWYPPEPLDLESLRLKLQTDEKVELPHKPEGMTEPEPEGERLGDGIEGLYDPSVPLEIAMDDESVNGIGDGEIVFDPNHIDPDKIDPRDG